MTITARYNANIHRGVYQLSEQRRASTRRRGIWLRRFINAALAARVHLRPQHDRGDQSGRRVVGAHQSQRQAIVILSAVMEHHSNLVPWHMLREEIGFEIDDIPLTDDPQLDMDGLR